MDEEVKKVFYPGPMVSFESARKVSSYLVRATVYPIERTIGSLKCSDVNNSRSSDMSDHFYVAVGHLKIKI